MNLGSCFSGIAGIELGFLNAFAEFNAPLNIKWMIEINEYRRKILDLRHPNVTKFTDIKETDVNLLEGVDMIVGGFPCQDISEAGRKEGITGERSGLWYEMSEIIRQVGPKFVLVENVKALLRRGIDEVLRCLAENGYDAEWSMLSARQFGAPHLRERIFILAYKGIRDLGRGETVFANQLGSLRNKRQNSITWLTPLSKEGFRSKMSVETNAKRNKPHSIGNISEQMALHWKASKQNNQKFPTPTKGMWKQDVCDNGRYAESISGKHQIMLPAYVKLFRTPMARDWKGKSSLKWRTRKKGDNTPTLPDQIFMLESLRKINKEFADAMYDYDKYLDLTSDGTNLNPDWVELLMGFPSGWTVLDGTPSEYRLNAWPGSNTKRREDVALWEGFIPRMAKTKEYHIERLESIGDAVVPQVAHHIARKLIEFIQTRRELRYLVE